MTVKHTLLASMLVTLMLAISPVRAATEDTVQAVIPWDAEGQLWQVGPKTILFLGAMEGILYVEKSSGEMHMAFVECPIMQQLDGGSGSTNGIAHCQITAGPEDVIYATMTCEGRVGGGGCDGEFNVTAGVGKFTGITGLGKLKIRSPIRALATDGASGNVLRIGSGIAIIKDLKFKIP